MMKATSLALCLCFLGISSDVEAPANEAVLAAPANVEDVLARLEQRVGLVETLKAKFVQEKHLAVLDRPLILEGTIFMQKPDLFAWHVTKPLRYSIVIQDEVVRQWDEDTQRVQKIVLSKNPAFKIAIRQMRDWFSGSYKSMLGEYEATILNEDPISIKFIPHETSFAQGVINSVTVVFETDERYIRQIHIVEKRGDSTLITFVNTLLNIPIDPSAWKVRSSRGG